MLRILLIWSSLGSGSLSIRFLARTTIPGVQKPHCKPPAAIKLSANVSRSSSLKPSRVRIDLPATLFAGTAQDTTALPSTITVQHPHWPVGLQPSLGDRIPHRSRRSSSSDIPPSIWTERSLAFKLNSIVSVISRLASTNSMIGHSFSRHFNTSGRIDLLENLSAGRPARVSVIRVTRYPLKTCFEL